MLWPWYVAACVVLALISDRRHALCLALIALGLVAMFPAFVFLDLGAAYLAQALTWISLGLFVGWRASPVSGILLVVAAVIVLPARVVGAPHEIWSHWALVVSDLCGVAAILALGWPGLRRSVVRGWHLVNGARRSLAGDRRSVGAVEGS